MNNASQILSDIKEERLIHARHIERLGDSSIQSLLYAIAEDYEVSFKDGAKLIDALCGAINRDIEGVYFDFIELLDVATSMSIAIEQFNQANDLDDFDTEEQQELEAVFFLG